MEKYRFYTTVGFSPYCVQEKKWWGWKTIYRSSYYENANNTLKQLMEQKNG